MMAEMMVVSWADSRVVMMAGSWVDLKVAMTADCWAAHSADSMAE